MWQISINGFEHIPALPSARFITETVTNLKISRSATLQKLALTTPLRPRHLIIMAATAPNVSPMQAQFQLVGAELESQAQLREQIREVRSSLLIVSRFS